MPTQSWIAALVLGALSLSAAAEPLGVNTRTTGRITSIENGFQELGGAPQLGMPVHVDFNYETNTAFATLDSGGWATMPASGFFQFSVSVGSALLGLRSPATSSDPTLFNQFRLRDDVRNAAGDLVDVVELTARAHTQYDNVTYTFSANLEFAPRTFDDLDNRSILALDDARPRGGTMRLNRVAAGWDGTLVVSDLFADMNGFDARFEGPGAVMPVAEPGQCALLLVGLMAMAGSGVAARREKGAVRGDRSAPACACDPTRHDPASQTKKSGPKPAFR
jgi:hypothetical protein